MRGLTLLEVVVVVAVLAILAGLLAPAAGELLRESKANRIAALSDRLKEACHRFLLDTGLNALEDGGSESAPKMSDRDHTLWTKEAGTLPGWNGPYINDPLSYRDNPTGGGISVLPFPSAMDPERFPGFALTASGGVSGGEGNMLVLGSVDLELAMAVDEILDADAKFGRWDEVGRVAYVGTTLFIFLLENP